MFDIQPKYPITIQYTLKMDKVMVMFQEFPQSVPCTTFREPFHSRHTDGAVQSNSLQSPVFLATVISFYVEQTCLQIFSPRARQAYLATCVTETSIKMLVHSGNLTQLWIITIFNGKTHYQQAFPIAYQGVNSSCQSIEIHRNPSNIQDLPYHRQGSALEACWAGWVAPLHARGSAPRPCSKSWE